MPEQYSRLNNALHFLDLLEDDRSKLSLTKVSAWLGMVANYGNLTYQFFAAHADLALLGATSLAHAVSAIKHEMKRRG